MEIQFVSYWAAWREDSWRSRSVGRYQSTKTSWMKSSAKETIVRRSRKSRRASALLSRSRRATFDSLILKHLTTSHPSERVPRYRGDPTLDPVSAHHPAEYA